MKKMDKDLNVSILGKISEFVHRIIKKSYTWLDNIHYLRLE